MNYRMIFKHWNCVMHRSGMYAALPLSSFYLPGSRHIIFCRIHVYYSSNRVFIIEDQNTDIAYLHS